MPRHALGGVLTALIVLPLAGGCQTYVRTADLPSPGGLLTPAVEPQVARGAAPAPAAPVPVPPPVDVGVPPSPAPQPVAAPTPAHPPGKGGSIEGLMARLKDLQAQKAELEKAEKETAALLKEKLKQQRQRLRKMGVGGKKKRQTPPTPPVPAARG